MPGLIEAGCRERLLVGRRGSDVRVSADAAVLSMPHGRSHAGGRRGEPGAEEGGDWDFVPDIVVRDGDLITANVLAEACGKYLGWAMHYHK